jgi:uncharacterized Rmd1/YagE family protein
MISLFGSLLFWRRKKKKEEMTLEEINKAREEYDKNIKFKTEVFDVNEDERYVMKQGPLARFIRWLFFK